MNLTHKPDELQEQTAALKELDREHLKDNIKEKVEALYDGGRNPARKVVLDSVLRILDES